MTPWINYHHLLYFKTIAEEGSISSAAQKLRLGQPALSAQLKQLEISLGVTLFDRKHKKLILTEHGKLTLEYSKNIFSMGTEMYEALHDRLKPLKPTLHIGAQDSVPKQFIVKIAQKAQEISPCQITMSEGQSGELIRELVSHRMDLVLANFLPSGADAKGLIAKRLSKENISIWGAPKFRHLKKKFPQSLSGQPMILPTHDSKLRHDFSHWSNLNQIDLNVAIESQDISVKVAMAEQGMGLIATTALAIPANKWLIEIGKIPGLQSDIYMIFAQRKIENPIVKSLQKWI